MGSGSSLSCDVSLNTRLNAEERRKYQDPKVIREILDTAKNIAVYGLSSDKQKASFFVANYLQSEGYRIIPINPRGGEILGETVYPSLLDVPADTQIDVVDIFRPPQVIPSIVDEAIQRGNVKAIWMQLRLINLEAAQKAVDARMTVIIDKCTKMEHGRYHGRLNWAGMNSEIISARKAKM